MWDKIILGALAIFGAVVAGYAVYAVYVAYLTRSKAKNIALNTANEKFRSEIGKAVIEKLDKGNYKVAKIGLYDKSSKKIAEIKVEADNISNDLSEGDILLNYS